MKKIEVLKRKKFSIFFPLSFAKYLWDRHIVGKISLQVIKNEMLVLNTKLHPKVIMPPILFDKKSELSDNKKQMRTTTCLLFFVKTEVIFNEISKILKRYTEMSMRKLNYSTMIINLYTSNKYCKQIILQQN